MNLVSVVIPFFNRVGWVIEAIKSVINQTYPYFEIILVNDGSTDNISEIQAMKDERIHLVRQCNRGPSAARNLGISMAKGKYVSFLDSDDLFLNDKLYKQVFIMEKNPEVVMSHTSYYRINSDGSLIDRIDSGKFSGDLLYPEILYGCPIAMPTVMIRRDLLLIGDFKFEEKVHIAEDLILWSRISRMSKIVGIEEPLTKVRIHGSNASTDPQKQLEATYNIIKYSTKYDNNLSYFFKHKKVAMTFYEIANIYFKKDNYFMALKYALRSFIAWPFYVRKYRFFARVALYWLGYRRVVRLHC